MAVDVFMAGLGGQGVLFAGEVLARAAVLSDLQASWLPAYMPEVRGGETTCTVVIDTDLPKSPIIGRPTYAILMEQAAAQRYLPSVHPGGLAFVNSTLTRQMPAQVPARVIQIPATEMAARLATERAANMVILGAFAAVVQPVPLEKLQAALEEVCRGRGEEILRANIAALQAGADWAAENALVPER